MRQISAKLMGLSSNSRVTEKIEEQVNLACSAQIWQVKKEVRLPVHYTKEQHSNPHHFFSFFFLYSCPPMYPYYLAWSTENQPTRFSLHIQLQLLCWKTMLQLHTDPNLIDKSIGNQTFEQTIWLWNHTSHTKNTSMNLLQMPCVITWSWSFLTSKVVKAVRGQKHHILAYTWAF